MNLIRIYNCWDQFSVTWKVSNFLWPLKSNWRYIHHVRLLFKNWFLGLDILIFIIIYITTFTSPVKPRSRGSFNFEHVDQSSSSDGGGSGGGGGVGERGHAAVSADCIQILCDIPRLSKTDLEIHWFLAVLVSVPCFAVYFSIWCFNCPAVKFMWSIIVSIHFRALKKTDNTQGFQTFLGMKISL